MLDRHEPKKYVSLMTREAEAILQTIRAHKAELQAMGAKHLALFGSYATGMQTETSDVDIGVKFEAAKRGEGLAYFRVWGDLQDRLSIILETEVHLSDEDLQKPAVQENYVVDRLYAF